MDTSNKQVLDKKWARFFYEANIPFNVARHPAFVDAVKSTSESRVQYKPPAYHALRTKLMTSTKDEVAALISEKTRGPIHKYGVTICSDGWDNVTHRPLMNVMLACTSGEIFLGSVDMTGERKDAIYVASRVKDYIEAVGGQNVVQVCTDNVATMRLAGTLLIRDFPHIYWQGCAAHVLDLLLEDWGEQVWVAKMVKKAKSIVKFIRMHHIPLAIFRRHSPNLMLKLPVETRFATMFLMIERLVKVKEAVESTVHDPEWNEFRRTLQGNGPKRKTDDVRRRVRKDEFWRRCLNFVHMVEPVLIALREFDGKRPAMGKAWIVMKKVEKHVLALRDPPFSLEAEYAEHAERAFYTRWTMMLTDLHYAAALLNPFLLDEVTLMDDNEAREAILEVLRKLTTGGFAFAAALSEYQAFRDRRGVFAGLPDVNTLNLEPHEWWDLLGAGARTLSPIAKKILAQVCSSSSCERNWSMYSFVHSKSRNRLTTERAEELVYIYTNSRTLRERGAADPARWYTENMLSEDSMTDESDHSDGLDRGSVLSGHSGADNDDSDSSSDGNDHPPFRPLGERQQRGPLIDESVFDFDAADNDGNDHGRHEDVNGPEGDEDGTDLEEVEGSPVRVPNTTNGRSGGGNQNEGVIAPPSIPMPGPSDEEVATIRDEHVALEERQEPDQVVATQVLRASNTRGAGPPLGMEVEVRTLRNGTVGSRQQTPVSDEPSTQNSSQPSSSRVRPNEATPSVGDRLAALQPTLNMLGRRNALSSSGSRLGPVEPPPHPNNGRRRPREEGASNDLLNTRPHQRRRIEPTAVQPFVRSAPTRPNVDGVGNTAGGRPLRTLSSIVRQGANARHSASSESGSAPLNHGDDSIGVSVDEDGEVPGDSDYRGPRRGPPLGPRDQEATTGEANVGGVARNRRPGRH
jgi:hypothetical protein